MDPLSYYNDPGLQQAQQQSQQAGTAYKTAVGNASTMPDLLKQALDKKFSENNPLIQERSTATANYLNEFTNAPQAVQQPGMVFNPQEQANLIQQRRSSALIPVMNANELLSWQQGGISNTVGEATKMYEAVARAAGIELENKRQQYMDILNLISQKAQAAESNRNFSEGQRQFAEGTRRFDLEYELAKQKAAQEGNGGFGDFFEWYKNQQGGEEDDSWLDAAIDQDLDPRSIFGTEGLSYLNDPTADLNRLFGVSGGLSVNSPAAKITPTSTKKAAAPLANMGGTATRNTAGQSFRF